MIWQTKTNNNGTSHTFLWQRKPATTTTTKKRYENVFECFFFFYSPLTAVRITLAIRAKLMKQDAERERERERKWKTEMFHDIEYLALFISFSFGLPSAVRSMHFCKFIPQLVQFPIDFLNKTLHDLHTAYCSSIRFKVLLNITISELLATNKSHHLLL